VNGSKFTTEDTEGTEELAHDKGETPGLFQSALSSSANSVSSVVNCPVVVGAVDVR